jgi:hypothetical protein
MPKGRGFPRNQMIKTMTLILALSLVGMAQTKPADPPKPAQPPTLEMGKKLAMAQRDYVAAMSKLQVDQADAQKASDALKTLTSDAEKICGGKEWVLDQMAAECVAKPLEKKVDAPAPKDGGSK